MANKVMICGYVAKDSEIKTTTNGKNLVKFSVNFRTTKKEDNTYKPEWIDVTVWERNENCFTVASKIQKGDTVVCFGIAEQRTFVNKEGVSTIANEFTAEIVIPQKAILKALLGSTETSASTAETSTQLPASVEEFEEIIGGGELPF